MIADHLGEDDEPGSVLVGIEADRGPWVQSLIAAGYVVYAINPMQVSRCRERHSSSGAKSDPGDAHVLAEIVRTTGLITVRSRVTASRPRWSRLSRAVENKQSQDALAPLAYRYRSLSPNDRSVVDVLLAEQVLSSEDNVRFDALSLIEDFKIRSAEPALRRLADRLEHEDQPGTPYEWAKVNRILGNLVSGGP